jgi:ABC-type uncharacterized transport system ATPase subunit
MRIEIEKTSKQFGSLSALENVSLELEPGQILVVPGANGAASRGYRSLRRVEAYMGVVLREGQSGPPS